MAVLGGEAVSYERGTPVAISASNSRTNPSLLFKPWWVAAASAGGSSRERLLRAIVPSCFHVCITARHSPAPPLPALILGRFSLFALARERQCLGIQQLPGPGAAVSVGDSIVGG